MNTYSTEEIIAALEHAEYRFAKTMPNCPHCYTLRSSWQDQQLFDAAVRLTRELGRKERWGKAVRPYFRHGEYKYWTMGSRVESTILINRALIADYPNQRPIES